MLTEPKSALHFIVLFRPTSDIVRSSSGRLFGLTRSVCVHSNIKYMNVYHLLHHLIPYVISYYMPYVNKDGYGLVRFTVKSERDVSTDQATE